ncbi:MAG: hypothetical protein AAF465_09965 [Pseudomonadota bacterium]
MNPNGTTSSELNFERLITGVLASAGQHTDLENLVTHFAGHHLSPELVGAITELVGAINDSDEDDALEGEYSTLSPTDPVLDATHNTAHDEVDAIHAMADDSALTAQLLEDLAPELLAIETELATLREDHELLADALGMCSMCLGEDPECEHCLTETGLRTSMPDVELFEEFVFPCVPLLPARTLRRLMRVAQHTLERSTRKHKNPGRSPAFHDRHVDADSLPRPRPGVLTKEKQHDRSTG